MFKTKTIKFAFLLVVAITNWVTSAQANQDPVTPHASPEAKALLTYLYKVSKKGQILTGQHNAPLQGSTRLVGMYKQTGKYPAIFGQDFGFSEPGSWDGINFRQNIVDEAIQRHRQGFINTLMWHAIIPTQDEPGDFKQSIQAQLSDEQWKALTTPGSGLNERWKSQVDVIAWHLKQLQYANVPILWRPYHEMNGFWFWWAGRQGPEGYEKLWRMLFERLVNFHQLDNLIWVWNANEMKEQVPEYKLFYPGHDVVDVLATDVYTQRYDEDNYNKLLALAEGRPIALGEVGGFPSVETLEAQPAWAWFMSWRDPDNFSWNDGESLLALFNYKKAISRQELPWVKQKDRVKLHAPILE